MHFPEDSQDDGLANDLGTSLIPLKCFKTMCILKLEVKIGKALKDFISWCWLYTLSQVKLGVPFGSYFCLAY